MALKKRPFKVRLVKLDRTDEKYFKIGDIIDVYVYHRYNKHLYMTYLKNGTEYYFRNEQVAKVEEVKV